MINLYRFYKKWKIVMHIYLITIYFPNGVRQIQSQFYSWKVIYAAIIISIVIDKFIIIHLIRKSFSVFVYT